MRNSRVSVLVFLVILAAAHRDAIAESPTPSPAPPAGGPTPPPATGAPGGGARLGGPFGSGGLSGDHGVPDVIYSLQLNGKKHECLGSVVDATPWSDGAPKASSLFRSFDEMGSPVASGNACAFLTAKHCIEQEGEGTLSAKEFGSSKTTVKVVSGGGDMAVLTLEPKVCAEQKVRKTRLCPDGSETWLKEKMKQGWTVYGASRRMPGLIPWVLSSPRKYQDASGDLFELALKPKSGDATEIDADNAETYAGVGKGDSGGGLYVCNAKTIDPKISAEEWHRTCCQIGVLSAGKSATAEQPEMGRSIGSNWSLYGGMKSLAWARDLVKGVTPAQAVCVASGRGKAGGAHDEPTGSAGRRGCAEPVSRPFSVSGQAELYREETP